MMAGSAQLCRTASVQNLATDGHTSLGTAGVCGTGLSQRRWVRRPLRAGGECTRNTDLRAAAAKYWCVPEGVVGGTEASLASTDPSRLGGHSGQHVRRTACVTRWVSGARESESLTI